MNAMRMFVRCVFLVALMQLPNKAEVITVDVPQTAMAVPNNICLVEEKINLTRLLPTANTRGISLCLNVPRLCPKDVFDKYAQVLVEVKIVIVEKCCPGFVRSAFNSDCVKIEEMPLVDYPSDYLHLGNTDIYPRVMLSKIAKAFAEEYGYNESELSLEDFVYGPFPNLFAASDQERRVDIPSDNSEENVHSEGAKPEENKNVTPLKSFEDCAELTLLQVAGILLTLAMFFFNIFLFIMVYKSCWIRCEEEIFSEVEEIVMSSSKCAIWVDKVNEEKPAGNTASATAENPSKGTPLNGPHLADGEPTGSPRKIMSLMEIKKVITDVLANLAVFNGKASKLKITEKYQTEGGNDPNEHSISSDKENFIIPGKASKSTNTETGQLDGGNFPKGHAFFPTMDTFIIPDSVAMDIDFNGLSAFDALFNDVDVESDDDDVFDDSDDSDYTDNASFDDTDDSDADWASHDIDKIDYIEESDTEKCITDSDFEDDLEIACIECDFE